MEFYSNSFPDTTIHIGLFQLKGSDENLTANQFEQRKAQLAAIAKQHQENFTIVNARLVASLMHLNIAVSRSLLNKRDGRMKTQSFGNEIVYHITPQHSI